MKKFSAVMDSYYELAEALRTGRVRHCNGTMILDDYDLFVLPDDHLNSVLDAGVRAGVIRSLSWYGDQVTRDPGFMPRMTSNKGMVLYPSHDNMTLNFMIVDRSPLPGETFRLMSFRLGRKGWNGVCMPFPPNPCIDLDEAVFYLLQLAEMLCDYDYTCDDLLEGGAIATRALERRLRIGYPPLSGLLVKQLGEPMTGRSFMGGACEKRTVVGEDGTRRQVLHYPCEFCDASIEYLLRERSLNPDMVRNYLASANWQIVGYFKKFRCPSCRRGRGERRRPPEPVIEAVAEPIVEESMSMITPAVRRKVLEELESHFDNDRGEFLGNEDDGTIAERLDIPRAVVSEVREAFLGPVLVVPGIRQLQSDLEAARKLLAETDGALRDEITTMRTRLDDLEMRVRNEVNTISAVINDIERRKR